MMRSLAKRAIAATLAVLSLQVQGGAADAAANTVVADLTYYWNTYQSDFPGMDTVPVPGPNGQTLAVVSQAFWDTLHIEGTGVLRNGQVLTCYNSNCTQFFLSANPLGSNGSPLVPYRTVALNAVPLNTGIFIQQFVGRRMPDGRVHDGCFIVGDRLGSHGPTGSHIDFYAGSKAAYQVIIASLPIYSVNYEIQPRCATATWV